MDAAWDVGRLCFLFKYGLKSAGASAVHAIRPSVGVVVDVGGGKVAAARRYRRARSTRGTREETRRKPRKEHKRNTRCVSVPPVRQSGQESRPEHRDQKPGNGWVYPHDPQGYNEAGKRPKNMVRPLNKGQGGVVSQPAASFQPKGPGLTLHRSIHWPRGLGLKLDTGGR